MKKLLLMKTVLLLCALVAGSSNLWAEDETVATATFNGKNETYTEGWSTTGTGKGRTDCIVIGKGENITSPALDLSSYSKVTITFTGRRFGSLTGSKATVNVAISNTSKGTIDITNSSVAAVSGNINFVPTASMTAAVLVFTCTNATSAGSTHGAGIGSITIKGTPISSDPSIDAEDVEIEYDATGGTITSTINNPVAGGVLTAAEKVDADWLTLGSVSGTNVPFTTTTNDGVTDRTATVTLTYTYTDGTEKTVTKDVTITQGHEVLDYVTLPFSWAGGSQAVLRATDGVTLNVDNSDYAESNAPYRIKFNNTGKYITIKTNGQPGIVTVGVKKVGGANDSKIIIQESTDGSTYTDVQSFTTSGAGNAILSLETTNSFNANSRYVRIYFKKDGDNVGVGPISITECLPVTITSAEYATYSNATKALAFKMAGITVYTATDNKTSVALNEVTSGKVPANTPVVLYKAGADGTAINVPVIASADAVGDNDLRVSTGTDVDYMYVLAKPAGKSVGFYPWGGTTDLSAGKVYLQAKASYGARNFLGFSDDVTAIEAVKAQNAAKGEYFNLAGQRVAQPTKGLYIVNGKKAIVK